MMPLWDSNPFSLMSWWDMEKFSAEQFVTIGTLIQMLKEELGLPTVEGDAAFDFRDKTKVSMNGERRDKLVAVLDFMARECAKVSLKVTGLTIAQLKGDFLSRPEIGREYAIGRVAGLEGTLRAEMQESLFLYMPCDRKTYYQSPLKDWDEILKRFSKLRVDVEEASKCYACDRYAASIFHILLVAEFGVIEVAKLFGVEGDKPGWGALERLEKINNKAHRDRSEVEKQHSKFLENVLPLLLAVKDSWRHKISHVENKLVWLDTVFSPQIAEEVLSTTRGFMRRLAEDLP